MGPGRRRPLPQPSGVHRHAAARRLQGRPRAQGGGPRRDDRDRRRPDRQSPAARRRAGVGRGAAPADRRGPARHGAARPQVQGRRAAHRDGELHATTPRWSAVPHGVRVAAWFEAEGTIVGDGRQWHQARFNAFPSKAAFMAVVFDPRPRGAARPSGGGHRGHLHADPAEHRRPRALRVARRLRRRRAGDLPGARPARRGVRGPLGVGDDRRCWPPSQEPSRFAKLVLVGPSPRYIDDDGYVGGFSREDIAELLDSLESNYLGWSSAMAPVIMGNADRPELGEELTESFCRTDPAIARHFARVTFLSDNRADLAHGDGADARAAVHATTSSPRWRSASTCATRCPTARDGAARRHRALPEPQRARRDRRRHRRVRRRLSAVADPRRERGGARGVLRRAARRTTPRRSTSGRRAATCRPTPDGTIVKVNGTFLTWTGYDRGRARRSAARSSTC